MHRTNPVPRLFAWSTLFAGLVVLVSVYVASAQNVTPVNLIQEQPNKDDTPTVVMMTPGTTHIHTSNEPLKRVVNNNPKAINVSGVANEPKKVLFEAIAPGRARVTLTNMKDKDEFVDVVVISDRVKELRDVLAKVVPTGSVQVNSTNGDNTVILTGYVLTNTDGRVVQQAATNLFGANVINNIQIGGVQQVQLEVIIASVNRSEIRNMSFSWASTGQNAFAASIFGGPFAFTNALTPAVGGAGSALTQTGASNLPFGILNNKNGFQAFLQALSTESLAKIYANPTVVTLSGRPAQFVSGGKVPILTSSGQGAPSVSYEQFGTTVNFLPIVLGNGKIHLEVNPEISDVDESLSLNIPGISPTAIKGFRSRSARVAVQIEDGQTLAIGGLTQNAVNATISRVPVLGDLPFLGAAFTSKSYNEIEQELIILVTARLVDPIDCTKIAKYLPGRESRVPDDYELFLEGIIEAPRGPRNVIFHPHHYQAAHRHAANIGQYPCGDGNCAPRNGCANGSCAVPSFPLGTSIPVQRVQSGSPAPMPNRIAIELESVPVTVGQAPNLAPAIPTSALPNRATLAPVSFGPGRQ